MRFRKILLYIFLFLASFVFFVYISFPYTVFKEVLVAKLSQNLGVQIKIKTLSPDLPLGFELTNIEVLQPSGQPGIDLERADIRVSILPLLIGKLTTHLDLESRGKGTFELTVSWNIFNFFSGVTLPTETAIQAKKFKIGHIMKFAAAQGKEALKSQAILADFISKFGMEGNLNGSVKLDLDSSDVSKSSGDINLSVLDGILSIDPSFNLGDQNFEKALIKANLSKGSLVLDDQTGFHTQGMKIDLKGKIALKKNLDDSTLDLSLGVMLLQGLKDQLGFVIDTALHGSNGAFKAQIRGTVAHPNFVTI